MQGHWGESGGTLHRALVIMAWEARTRLPAGFCVMPDDQGERAGVDELPPHLRVGLMIAFIDGVCINPSSDR